MKKLVVILAVALLTTGLATALLWQRTQDEREFNAALQARVSALEAILPPAAAPLAAAAPAMAAAVTAEATAATPAPASAMEQAQAIAAGFNQVMATPEGREMLRAQARMGMGRLYPHLGAELGFSAAELDKFYDLLARQQSDLTVESMAVSEAGMDSAAMQDMQRKLAERRQANEAEITTALGSKYPQWTTYQQSLPIRRQVAQLQSLLGGDGDALSDAQARPLVATLAAEKARLDQEQRNAARPAPGTREQYLALQEQRTTESNRRLLEAAAAHLTPQQVASYKRLMDQEQDMNRMMRAMESQQRGAQAQGGLAVIATPR